MKFSHLAGLSFPALMSEPWSGRRRWWYRWASSDQLRLGRVWRFGMVPIACRTLPFEIVLPFCQTPRRLVIAGLAKSAYVLKSFNILRSTGARWPFFPLQADFGGLGSRWIQDIHSRISSWRLLSFMIYGSIELTILWILLREYQKCEISCAI